MRTLLSVDIRNMHQSAIPQHRVTEQYLSNALDISQVISVVTFVKEDLVLQGRFCEFPIHNSSSWHRAIRPINFKLLITILKGLFGLNRENPNSIKGLRHLFIYSEWWKKMKRVPKRGYLRARACVPHAAVLTSPVAADSSINSTIVLFAIIMSLAGTHVFSDSFVFPFLHIESRSSQLQHISNLILVHVPLFPTSWTFPEGYECVIRW